MDVFRGTDFLRHPPSSARTPASVTAIVTAIRLDGVLGQPLDVSSRIVPEVWMLDGGSRKPSKSTRRPGAGLKNWKVKSTMVQMVGPVPLILSDPRATGC